MKLVTFTAPSGDGLRPGLLLPQSVVELTPKLLVGIDPDHPRSTAADVLAHEPFRLAARRLWDAAAAGEIMTGYPVYDVGDVALAAPVPAPGKFVCIGLNYRDHAEEAGLSVGDVPTFFAKFNNAVTATGLPIVVPLASHRIDWEGELAFVMGQAAQNVPVQDALRFVAGYTIVNDVTARDYQFKTSQWSMGKTFDTFGPMGPCIVDAADIPDPQVLSLSTTVNGERKQSASTSNMIFSVAQILSFLSTVMTLEPGDVIATGTPAGIGALQTPRQWLRPGDVVETEVQGIGVLRNPVVAHPQSVAPATVEASV